jgi:hypothetical protein
MVSSSVTEEPSSATECLVLLLGADTLGTARSGDGGEAALSEDADEGDEGALVRDVGGV